jgi:hypothetical protein
MIPKSGPKERDEETGESYMLRLIHTASPLARMLPTLDLKWEPNTTVWEKQNI